MTVYLRGYGGFSRQREREHDVGPGRVRLRCLNPPLNIICRMGQDPPQITAGFGGWEVTQRPRAVGMTVWEGVPPCELTLSIMLGGRVAVLRNENSVEKAIRQIMSVARGTEDHVPGIVYIDGVPNLPNDRWVITNVEFGDAIRRKEDMHRIRAEITITFMEYRPPQYEQLRKGALARPKRDTVRYTVKKGDTPAKIARHRHCKWTDLKRMNRKGTIKKANQHPRKGTPFHVGAKINVPKVRERHHKGKHHRHHRGHNARD